MTNEESAAWEIRDMIDRAASVLQIAEDAQSALNRGASAEAAVLLTSAKEPARWIEVKREWALKLLGA